jgi:hypothetical protein
VIRWVYLKPGGRSDIDPVVYVPFVRDVSGEYRLSYDPKLASPFFTWSQLDDNRTRGFGSFLTVDPAGGRNALSVMLDLGKMQEVPPQETILLDEVESVETFAYLPLAIAIDRFQPEGSGLLAVVTVAIPQDGDLPRSWRASRGRVPTPRAPAFWEKGSFRIEGEGSSRVAQGRVLLDAGAPWDVTVLAVEGTRASAASSADRWRRYRKGRRCDCRTSCSHPRWSLFPSPRRPTIRAPFIIGGFRVTRASKNSLRPAAPFRFSSRSTEARRRISSDTSSKARKKTADGSRSGSRREARPRPRAGLCASHLEDVARRSLPPDGHRVGCGRHLDRQGHRLVARRRSRAVSVRAALAAVVVLATADVARAESTSLLGSHKSKAPRVSALWLDRFRGSGPHR